jgi:hypothetical protein
MKSVFQGQRPDLTPAQAVGLLVAGVPVLASLLRAFGVYDIGPAQEEALRNAVTWACAFAGLLLASDAGLRAARNAADGRRGAAALASGAMPHAHVPEIDEDVHEQASDEDLELALLAPDSGTVPDTPGDLR